MRARGGTSANRPQEVSSLLAHTAVTTSELLITKMVNADLLQLFVEEDFCELMATAEPEKKPPSRQRTAVIRFTRTAGQN